MRSYYRRDFIIVSIVAVALGGYSIIKSLLLLLFVNYDYVIVALDGTSAIFAL